MSDIKFDEAAQVIYDRLYEEIMRRRAISGVDPPTEEEIFKTLIGHVKSLIVAGELPAEFMAQLAEVKPQFTRERYEEIMREEREKAEKQGIILSLDDVL